MKPLTSYEWVRGFNYSGWELADEAKQRKEFSYALRLELNNVRIWLNPDQYEQNPKGYVDQLLRFVRVGHGMGISTMPILFNGNGLNPDILKEEYLNGKGGQYVNDIVGALKGEPGLFMWDVMNEPSCNDYILKAKDEREDHWENVNDFLHRLCAMVRSLDPDNAITIGHTYVQDIAPTLNDVDVFCFHDYLSTRRAVRATYDEALEISRESNKPFMNSEMCCLCRANPYDMALDICREYHTGWYLFELMIVGYWGDVHGIFYEDGTVRDPSIPAAVLGFSRKRTGDRVLPNPNKEGYAQKGIQMVKDALEEKTEVFHAGRKSIDEVLEAAEFCANLLEGCELVPMADPPTAQIERIRKSQDMQAARKLAYDLARLLQEYCQIL